MTFNIKIATNYTFLLGVISIFFSSCEKDENYPVGSLMIDNIENVYYAEEPVTLATNTRGLTQFIWKISDGQTYEGTSIEHIFAHSGVYEIKLYGYLGSQLVDSSIYSVHVRYKFRTINRESTFYALRSTTTKKNTIVVEGLYDGEYETKFLEFDQNLNFIGEYDNQGSFGNTLFNNVQLGEETISLDNDYRGVINNDLKTSSEYILPDNYYSQEVMKYASGLIHYFQNDNSDFQIDFYNTEYNKLWTKTFSGIGKADEKYVFNNEDKLFYISFAKQDDKVCIEKFKNISLSYQSKSFELGINAPDRQILFATYKPGTKTIDLAVYSKSKNITRIYAIDEDCNLSLSVEINHFIDGKVRYALSNGDVFFKSKDKITKYNNNWSVLEETNLDNQYFDIFQMGDNQYLVCESLAHGIRLSYVNKHLEPVIFE
jgi:hypothetical protein